MNVVYALQQLPKSIFLAGPTPRSNDVQSWRLQALKLLEQFKFDGTVFVPESDTWLSHDNYDSQIRWEWDALNAATVVVFWIPRNIELMPGFTTNVEFGMLANSGKVVFGSPPGAAKMGYLKALAHKNNIPTFSILADTLEYSIMIAAQKTAYPNK